MRLNCRATVLLASFLMITAACGSDGVDRADASADGRAADGRVGGGAMGAGMSGGGAAAGAVAGAGGTGMAGAAGGAAGMLAVDAAVDAASLDGGTSQDDGGPDGATSDAGADAAVDECAAATSPCSANATCTDLVNGYACTCKPGFTGNGVTCVDVDECATNHGGCDALAACTNTPGSHTCGDCPTGYTGSGASGCVDVDECTAGTANCSANAICANAPGSFSCTCKSGFTGNGVVCSACSSCGAGKFQMTACTATADTSCGDCSAACLSCTDASTCTACPPGSYLSDVGTCVACAPIAGCTSGVTCTGPGASQCTTCAAEHYLANGTSDACNVCSPACSAPGTYASSECSTAHDRVCSDCAAPISSTSPGYASVVELLDMDGQAGAVADGAQVAATLGSAGTADNPNGSGLAFADGRVGQALTFDGVDDRLNLGDLAGADFGTEDFSIRFWFKSTPTGNTQWILSKRAICAHSNFWNIGISGGGNLIFEVDQNGDNYRGFVGSRIVTDGAWHHAAFVRAGTSLVIYVDGAEDGREATDAPTDLGNDDDVLVGHIACAGTQYFSGALDELTIWKGHALTASEVAQVECTP